MTQKLGEEFQEITKEFKPLELPTSDPIETPPKEIKSKVGSKTYTRMRNMRKKMLKAMEDQTKDLGQWQKKIISKK